MVLRYFVFPFENLKMEWKHVFLAVLFLAVRSLEASDAMKFLVPGFMAVLDECKKELNINDQIIITDLYNFWKLDFSLLHRETGCVIICMGKKLELLDESGKLHHGNAKEFAKKHGAADELASKMITVIHDCEAENESIPDDCTRILEMAKCFRSGIHELHWEPKVDIIVTEVLTEI